MDKSFDTLLELREVRKVYGGGLLKRAKRTIALDNVSISINSGRQGIIAIAGESGSGKTTMANILLGITKPTAGSVFYLGNDISKMTRHQRRDFRREVQTIFQDPFEAYNPFYKVDHVLHSPIKNFGLCNSSREAFDMIVNALELVGLRPQETLGRFPHQLSGGQRQRIMVARALLLQPRVIIADEPVSMVDASLRATILESINKLNKELGIAIIYITHDLTTAYQISDNIVVLYQGKIAESGNVETVIGSPKHPYTRLLVDSIPQPDPKRRWGENIVTQETGRPVAIGGCNFAFRCPYVMDECVAKHPPLFQTEEYRSVACYLEEQESREVAKTASQTFVNIQ